MPHGFAPKFGIDAIFVAGAPAQAPGVTAADPAAAASRVAAEEVRIKTPPLPVRISRSQREAAAENRTAVASVSAQTKAPPASPPAEAKEAAPVAAGSPSSPTIINRQGVDTGSTSQEAAEPPPTATVAAADTAKSNDGEELAMEQPAPSHNPQTTQAAQNQSETGTSGFGSYLRDHMTVAVSMLALPSAILIAGFVLLRRRDSSRAHVATSRDIDSVWPEESRGREEKSSALVAGKGTAVPTSAPQPPSPQSAPERIPDVTSGWGDTIPQDRSEALRVLGIGVSSDANRAAIKKIVGGLRMSWHPDHANAEDDRRIRELRLKQIKAAWEIISEPRADELV